MSSTPITFRAGLAALATAVGATLATAPAAAADFYAGKSIDLLIGAPPGGGYDIYARVVGRHLGRHIPGNPNIVPKNMPGAGQRARRRASSARSRPRTAPSSPNIMPGAVMGPLLDPKAENAVRSDQGHVYRQRQQRHPRVRTCRHSKIKTFDDARRPEGVFGGGSPNDSPATTATCTENDRRELGRGHRLQAARPISRSRSSAARSTASAAGTGRA